MNLNNMILYRGMQEGKVLEDILDLVENEGHILKGTISVIKGEEDEKRILCSCIHNLVNYANKYGFEGNLWHTYLTWLLVNHENPYSMACEIGGDATGSIDMIAKYDYTIWLELYQIDLLRFAFAEEEKEKFAIFLDYKGFERQGKTFNKRIRDSVCELSVRLAKAETVEVFQSIITEFYKQYGVGKFGLHKAFRIEHGNEELRIVPIKNIANVYLDDLIGYEIPKQKLVRNTQAFVEGRPANNCLLFGDAGTGKSSSIKAILNQYYDKGLRMIEIYKHQFKDLNDVIAQIKNRDYKFIIYMDDLSFEEFEIEYKYLKAVIEGGLEKKPDNVLIYATSNRRHLVREQFSDKEGRRDDLHASDTVQEKLSLAARFGESIFFVGPSRKEFQSIVLELAKRNQIRMTEEELLLAANKWELQHNGLSGRTAQQFIDALLSEQL
jgi:Predicted ATPase (AAA+ superfamily)